MVTSSSGLTGARFDRYSVDLSSGALLRSGVRIPVQGQPFQVLRLLLEAEGKVVSRDELRTALWPEDTFVDFELGVNTAVKKLRQALEDSAEHPRFIETLPKYGYRFMVPVEWVGGNNGHTAIRAVDPIPPPEPTPVVTLPVPVERHWKLNAAVAIAALAVVASLISLSDERSPLSGTRLGMLTRRVVLGRSTPTQPTVIERRLTANPEDTPVTSAVISPDGKYLAYTDKTGFYLKQVSSGETHPVPLPKGFEPTAESWFPDNIHMAVSWVEQPNSHPTIWAISVLGGTPRKLAEDGYSARVSPDGSEIAFLRGKFYSGEVWLMRVDNGHSQRIAGGTEAEIEDGFSPAAWAPGGGRFAFVRTTTAQYLNGNETKVEVADVVTGAIHPVLSHRGLGPALSWTQDDRLVYSLQEQEPNQDDFNLWWVRLDTQTESPLGSASRITNGRGFTAELSVTIDGKLLALSRLTSQHDVYIAKLSSDGKRLSTPQRLTLDERQDYPYSWTPDGKSLIFISDRDGRFHIFKQALDQTQPELLVGGDEELSLPRLAPNGATLLYLSGPRRVNSSHVLRLMRVPLAGGPSELVLESPSLWNQQCARSPSALCIYSTRGPDVVKFSTFDPVTGSNTEVPEAKVTSPWISWSLSPDGKYLATGETKFANQPRIRILAMADHTWRLVPVPGWAQMIGIDWAADGKSIWVGAIRNTSSFGRLDIWALLRLDLDGTINTVLESSTVRFSAAIPSPDGKRLALFGATDPSNVWLLQNF